jgi:protein TonB
LPAPVERVVEPPPILIEALTPSPIAVPPPAPTPPQPPVEAAYAPVRAPPAPAPITPPRFNADYLQNPAPPYPALARRMREQGKVLVRVLVSTDGVAEQIELKSSSGSTRLDQSGARYRQELEVRARAAGRPESLRVGRRADHVRARRLKRERVQLSLK